MPDPSEPVVGRAAAHVSLNVADLDRAIAFYRTLFGVGPSVHHPDYAKFDIADPPLVLSLEPVFHRSSDAFNHLGLRLRAEAEVKDAHARLAVEGAVCQLEENSPCCYSLQTKFWLADPDRNLWEVYAVTGELEDIGALSSSDALAARDRGGAIATWEHRLGDAAPARIPHDDGTLDEARLRGSFNEREDAIPTHLVADAFRALRRGGVMLVHGLVADVPFPGGFPRLPGPAATVRHAPAETYAAKLLVDAGFVSVYVQKFPERANFSHGPTAFRELMLFGWKPHLLSEGGTVLYRGPFASVTDDAGRTFRRGERAQVDADAVAALKHGPMADQFVFLH